MEWSSEELTFFSEGYVFTFNQPIVSRIQVEDDRNAKYMAEVYVTRGSDTRFDYHELHLRIFEQNEEEATPMLYDGKKVQEIKLEIHLHEGPDFLEFRGPDILLEDSTYFETMSMEPSPVLNGLTLIMATKVFLANVMRYLTSPVRPKIKKAVSAD